MLFADLDVKAASQLLQPVTNVSYESGEAIYQQGDESTTLYSLRTGIVKLSVVSPQGDMRIVRLLGPGAAIGLECLVSQPYQHIAEALSEVNVCRIPSPALQRIADQQPQLYQRIMGQWQEHLELADSHLLSLSVGTVEERVLNLLTLIDSICTRSGSAFLLPGNRDCAALVAARFESVSRVMAELKREGVLNQDQAGEWHLDPKQR